MRRRRRVASAERPGADRVHRPLRRCGLKGRRRTVPTGPVRGPPVAVASASPVGTITHDPGPHRRRPRPADAPVAPDVPVAPAPPAGAHPAHLSARRGSSPCPAPVARRRPGPRRVGLRRVELRGGGRRRPGLRNAAPGEAFAAAPAPAGRRTTTTSSPIRGSSTTSASGPATPASSPSIRSSSPNRTFRPELCLMQFCAAGETVGVDPFELTDLTPWWDLMTDDRTTVIVHGGQAEVKFCLEATAQAPRRLVDVQLAEGLRSTSYPLGYDALVQRVLNVRPQKGSQTRTDWRRRPLSADQLDYALRDAEFLPKIWEIQRKDLAGTRPHGVGGGGVRPVRPTPRRGPPQGAAREAVRAVEALPPGPRRGARRSPPGASPRRRRRIARSAAFCGTTS